MFASCSIEFRENNFIRKKKKKGFAGFSLVTYSINIIFEIFISIRDVWISAIVKPFDIFVIS